MGLGYFFLQKRSYKLLHPKDFLTLGALFSGTGVVLGAFGAHFLKARLSQDMLAVFEVGVRYQIYHGLALCLLGALGHVASNKWMHYSGWSFLAGSLIFSGSLYILALTGIRAFGAVTPVGGLLLIIGWFFLVLSGMNLPR